MAQAQVDEWCAEAAKTHYMQVSETEYAAVPREAAACPTRRFRACTRTWTTTPTRWSARARSSASRTDAPSTRSSACRSRPLPSARRRTAQKEAVSPLQLNPARPSRLTTASRVRRPDRAQALPQPRRRRGRRGARLPGGRDVRRRGHHARAARAVRGHHLAAGLHLWPVAALPDLGARRGGGARRGSRARPTSWRTRRPRTTPRAGGALAVRAAQVLLQWRRAPPHGLVALLGVRGGGAAQLDLHVRPRDGRARHRARQRARARRVRRAHACRRPPRRPPIGAPLKDLVGVEDCAEAQGWWAPFARRRRT